VEAIVSYAINFVCTDKGQHPRCIIRSGYTADDMPDGHVHVWLCPRCGRAPQVRLDRWPGVAAGLEAAGITEVDISKLPF
jgi:hypothetical protein